jgi:hypothetical protein
MIFRKSKCAKQNSWIWILKERRAQQENNTFESWQNLESSDPLLWRSFLRSRKQKFGENQGSDEFFYGEELSIYRGEGG